MAAKSKILIIGGTGYIGKFIVQASAAAGHPTFVLVRDSTLSNPAPPKSDLIQSFMNSGVNFILGDLYDHESLVKAIKQIDVVISTVGYAQLNDQDKIIAAIKEAGGVKKFFPSEFGNDVWTVSMLLSRRNQCLNTRFNSVVSSRHRESLIPMSPIIYLPPNQINGSGFEEHPTTAMTQFQQPPMLFAACVVDFKDLMHT